MHAQRSACAVLIRPEAVIQIPSKQYTCSIHSPQHKQSCCDLVCNANIKHSQEMHIRLLCLLLCLSLVLHISLVAGQDLQPLPATSEVNGSTLVKASGSVRAGIPLSLYCNITGTHKGILKQCMESSARAAVRQAGLVSTPRQHCNHFSPLAHGLLAPFHSFYAACCTALQAAASHVSRSICRRKPAGSRGMLRS
mgnify:CR=1 FL=1